MVVPFVYTEEEYKKLEEENKMLHEEQGKLHRLWSKDTKHITELEERIRFLEQCLDNKEKVNKSMREEIRNLKEKLSEITMVADDEKQSIEHILELEKENKKLKNSIEYRKKKADKNQEKANQIDKIMNLPGVMVDGKIDWSKVAVYYCI